MNKKQLILITFLLTIELTSFGQKKSLIGTWIVTNSNKEDYHIHDTITFELRGEFRTTIVANTINTGNWSKRWFGQNKQLKLKACLHSADNIYKCRKHNWIWEIKQVDEDELEVIQHSDTGTTKLLYRKT
jgi:hypothetical protein